MKRLIAGIVMAALVSVVLVAPTPAYAWRGHFFGGFAVGALTGAVVGGLFAPRFYAGPPVVYQPAPVYVQPAPVYMQPAPVYAQPAPVCSDYWVDGYWRYGAWVEGHWERACR